VTCPLTLRQSCGFGIAALLLAAPVTASAQEQVAGGCPAGRIASIFVDNHSVFDITDPDRDRRVAWAFRLANRLHRPTRAEVIRGEILLQEGDCYEPEVLRESERVLRASAFLADVDIFPVEQPNGDVDVVVDTHDDWSTRVGLQMGNGDGMAVEGVELRDDNLFGYGRAVSAFYLRRWEEPYYGFSYATPQLFQTRWDFGVAGGKTPTGHFFDQSLAYPFIGESGKWALREQLQHEDRLFEYLARHQDRRVSVLFPERRRSFDIGSVYRLGGRGNLTLLGAAVTGEWISYPLAPRLSPGAAREFGTDSLFPLDVDMDSVSSVRAMLLIGQRNIRYEPVRGFDSVHGTEDLRLGFEAELGLGRSIPALSSQSDLAVEAGLFASKRFAPGVVLGTHALAEARQLLDSDENESRWSDILGQIDGWAYWRPREEANHLYVGAVSLAGGWNTTVPFQLTLGGLKNVRGYSRRIDPGAQRLVAAVERRDYLGWPYPHLFDLGTVVALEAGRVWPGDGPFAVEPPFRASAGFGLRAALPPRSRRTVRFDIGIPIAAGVGVGDVAFSVGIGQIIGAAILRNDPQLARSSRRAIATSLFTYPY
jgi:hypothetical protein